MLSKLFSLGLLGAHLASALVFEDVEVAPRSWEYDCDAHHSERIRLQVSVAEQNLDKIEEHILASSDPDHHRYGEHLKWSDIQKLTKPAAKSINSVYEWLDSHNVTKTLEDDIFITFYTDVGTASKMLDTTFGWWKNGANRILRTLRYSIPDHLADHVDFVQPTTMFASLHPHLSGVRPVKDPEIVANFEKWAKAANWDGLTAPSAAACNEAITPQCLLSLYNVHYGATGAGATGSKIAFGSFLNQSSRYTDLTTFENTIATYAKGQNFTVELFNGAINDQTSSDDATEANLDGQYIIGVSYPLPAFEYITAGAGPQIPDPNEPAGQIDNEPYVPFLAGVNSLAKADLANTISISYGEDEQTWPEKVAKKVCNSFMKLGSSGISVIFSSGDSGPGAICANRNGKTLKFLPNFPASCPYVTSVGATQNQGPEKAASFSSGGFSNYFKRPKYQNKAVKAYLSQIGTNFQQYYNAAGRGIPDVSAQGVNFLVVIGGIPEPVDGTSCSAPTFSSIIALLNAARISAGNSTLGFLNPLLYSSTSAFTDITTGKSTGCSGSGSEGKIAGASWNATTGWDPVTGLGTPDFAKLLAIVAPGTANTGGPV